MPAGWTAEKLIVSYPGCLRAFGREWEGGRERERKREVTWTDFSSRGTSRKGCTTGRRQCHGPTRVGVLGESKGEEKGGLPAATPATSIYGWTLVKAGNPCDVSSGLFCLHQVIPLCPASPGQASACKGLDPPPQAFSRVRWPRLSRWAPTTALLPPPPCSLHRPASHSPATDGFFHQLFSFH